MAENTQGIMALPENDDMRRPTISLDDSYDAITTALTAARPDAAEAIDNTIAEAGMDLSELTDEQIDALIQAIQYLYDNPEEYKKTVEELIAKDYIDEGDLPAEYDPAFLSSFGMMLLQERRSRGTSTMTPPPQEFARGGIAEAARILASKGRNGDTMLAHITPEEARLLRSRGGSGTINPETGLPEFFIGKIVSAIGGAFKSVVGAVKSAFKAVGNVVKKVLSSDVGRIAATIALSVYLGPSGAGLMNSGFAAATASGAVTLASGGDVKDALKSAAFAYFTTPSSAPVTNAAGQVTTPGFTNPISEWVGSTTAKYAGNPFVDGAVKAFTSMPESVQKGITSVGLGTLAGVATGQDLQDAVKTGLTSGAVTTGIEAVNAARTGMASGQQALKTAAEAVDEAAASNMRGARNVFEQGLAGGPPEGVLQPGADIMKAGLGAADDMSSMQPAELARAQRDLSLAGAESTYLGGRIPAPADSAALATDATARRAGLSPTIPSYVEYDTGMVPGNLAEYAQQGPGGYPSNLSLRPPPNPADVLDIPGVTPTAAAAPSAPAGFPAQPPSVTESLAKTGGGVKDILTGDFAKGYEQVKGGLSDLFMPAGPTPEQIQAIEAKYGAGTQAAKAAVEQATPGILRTYGPATAAGIAGLGMMGGFEPKQPPPSELRQELSGTPGEDLIAGAPSEYVVQNLPGVTYSPEGQIVSVNAAQPTATLADVQQATGTYGMPIGMPQQGMPSAYMQDPYGYLYAQRQLIQPTQLADGGLATLGMTPTVYDSPVMNPMMQGGITTLRHGGTPHYPRRTGQISGPGTETSDDIPAMLSDGEFVMTARAVRGMGGGNRREGAKRMYALMHQLEKNAARG